MIYMIYILAYSYKVSDFSASELYLCPFVHLSVHRPNPVQLNVYIYIPIPVHRLA